MSSPERLSDRAMRVRDWVRAGQAEICDQIIPWEYGTVVRATHCPDYFSYNLVRVEREPDMDAQALVDFAESALAPLGHRRLDFEVTSAAEALRPDFISRGWSADRLLWLRHEAPLPSVALAAVSEVPYDAVAHLREQWNREGRQPEEHSRAFAAQGARGGRCDVAF